jgi:hypothetical protein
MQGSPTPAIVEADFRSKYLELANASGAARAIGIPESTGRDLAKRADEDPEFVELRRALYARALEEAEVAVMSVIRVHRKRAEKEPPKTIETAQGAFTPPDLAPAYGRNVIDGYRAVVAAKRFEAEKSGEVNPGPAVVIYTSGDEPGSDVA